MKRTIITILMIVLVFSVLGCGGNSDKAYKNASKEEGEDIEDSAQIQNALFNKQKWTVTTGMNKELPEYLGKMFSQKDGPDNSKINVSEAYYNFNKNNKHLTIEVHCKINNQNRLLKIDCGQISVEMHSLITGNEWVVKLYNGNNEINETWTGSYNKNQIEKKFWKSDIFSAKIKDNVIRIIFNTNIKIESN